MLVNVDKDVLLYPVLLHCILLSPDPLLPIPFQIRFSSPLPLRRLLGLPLKGAAHPALLPSVMHIDALHGVGLTRGSLPVGQDSAVVALHDGVKHGPRSQIVDVLLRAALFENVVEFESGPAIAAARGGLGSGGHRIALGIEGDSFAISRKFEALGIAVASLEGGEGADAAEYLHFIG